MREVERCSTGGLGEDASARYHQPSACSFVAMGGLAQEWLSRATSTNCPHMARPGLRLGLQEELGKDGGDM